MTPDHFWYFSLSVLVLGLPCSIFLFNGTDTLSVLMTCTSEFSVLHFHREFPLHRERGNSAALSTFGSFNVFRVLIYPGFNETSDAISPRYIKTWKPERSMFGFSFSKCKFGVIWASSQRRTEGVPREPGDITEKRHNDNVTFWRSKLIIRSVCLVQFWYFKRH